MKLHSLQVDDGRVTYVQELAEGSRLVLLAKGIRSERTGVHATVSVGLGETILAWSNFNVERDEARASLSRSAYAHITGPLAEVLDKEQLKHSLDLFCLQLWPAVVEAYSPTLEEGDPDSPPATFLVDGLVVEGGGSIIFGPPGRGKSYVGMALAVSVDAGLSAIWKVRQTPTLFINLERSGQSVRRRLAGVNRALGLEPKRPLAMLNARGRSLLDVEAALTRFVREHSIALLFLDSISRAGLGDLLEARTAVSIVDLLNRICPSWVALAHSPRADATHVFGSVHFEAGEDVGIKLSSQAVGDNLGVALVVTKSNDFAAPPPSLLALEFGEYGLVAIRTARHAEFPELEAGKPASTVEVLREYLLNVGMATPKDVAEATGFNRSNVSHTLANNPVFVIARKQGSQVYYGVRADDHVP